MESGDLTLLSEISEYHSKCTIDGIGTVSLKRGDKYDGKITKLGICIRETDQ